MARSSLDNSENASAAAAVVGEPELRSSVDSAFSYASSRTSLSSNSSLYTSLFSRVKDRANHVAFYRFFQSSMDSDDIPAGTSSRKKDKASRNGLLQQAMELEDLSGLSSAGSSNASSREASPTSAVAPAELPTNLSTASWSENDDPVVSKLSFGSDDSLDSLPERAKSPSSGWGFRRMVRFPTFGSSSSSSAASNNNNNTSN